ncbi:MAG: RMD1 family protein, partial [Clostridia bacterium]|nr:RMD1 family protein [Clostridia bacterium]
MDTPSVFRAFVVAGELDLNRKAERGQIPKKYTWEEALMLNGEHLSEVLGRTCSENESLYVFSFGSVVMVNLSLEDDQKVFSHLKTLDNRVNQKDIKHYYDKYELLIGGSEMELTDKYVSVPVYHLFQAELIATVLAKSVALKKIEEQQADIMDKVEPLIDKLERGRLRISDKKIANATAHIARCEYNSTAYIMILDKPDIT